MDPDIAIFVGVVLIMLSVPSIMSAFAESRPPRVSLLLLLTAGGLILFAMQTKPGGYTLPGMADAIYSVIARIIG